MNFLLAKLMRRKQYSVSNNAGYSLLFGTIYKMRTYKNWKHDPNPLVYIMYSGTMRFIHKQGHYTDAINLNYLTQQDKLWLGRMIYLMKKGNQKMNGRVFYRYLKTRRPSIIKSGYRRYHTNLIMNPKLVSAGVTNFTKMVYPYKDQFIMKLNENLSSTQGGINSNIQVAYNPTELRDRIISAQNSRPLSSNSMSVGRPAPWVTKI